ncbi:hypothetical protein NQZ68_027159 [Dissostichus eleginoides]|nr:hypothetical protein NQZ68_027159 [Dissostichus eleginoides]
MPSIPIVYPSEIIDDSEKKAYKDDLLRESPETLFADLKQNGKISNLIFLTDQPLAWHAAISAHYPSVNKKRIQDAWQFKFKKVEDSETGLTTVNVYDTGKVMVQGNLTPFEEDFLRIKERTQQENAAPTDNTQTLPETGTTPTDNNQTLPETDTTPTDNNQTLPETGTTPTDNNQTLPETGTTPTDNNQTLPETDTTPTDNNQTLPETGTTPTDNNQTLPETGTTPTDNNQTLPETDTTPTDNNHALPETDTTPTDNNQTLPELLIELSLN